MLERVGARLCLRALHHPEYGTICADWDSPDMRRRIAGGKRQLLARACGLAKAANPEILDATAGLGRDGAVLAALGARVTLVERRGPIAALLRDAQSRSTLPVELIEDDARNVLDSGRHWDIVYLDPMYPHRGKRALPQKEMQFFRELAGADEDAGALLEPARRCARRRVVVKRPLHAGPLGGVTPSLELAGTQARFDVYLAQA